MKYDDLEKTQELFDISESVPIPIENIEMEGISKNNVTDEFTLGLTDKEESEPPKEESKNKKESKKKKKEKVKWKDLPTKKKAKRIFLICLIIILIVAAAVCVYFFVLKSDKPDEPIKKPETPSVIIEKENYIYKDGKLSLLNSNDEEIGTYECNNKDEDLCYVAYFSDEDEFDTVKSEYEDGKKVERRSSIFFDKYVFIYDNNEAGVASLTLYNIEEEKEEGEYALVKGFADSNYVIVKNSEGKYGALEFTASGITEKIKPTLDYIGMMNKDSKLVTKVSDKYYISNKDGKTESKGVSGSIKSYNNKYIVVENSDYYVYDYQSKLLLEDGYDYIRLMDDYICLVSDNKLYIRDYEKNKYNEDGISLATDNYNETNIYTAEKTLSDTKKSFDVKLVENNLEVTIYTKQDKEKTTNLNIYDANLSNNYEYLNYLDGSLYFYNDEEKENLIGSYSCTNKNTVEKDTKTLSNCFIASDSFYSKNEVETDNSNNLGWIPIFNEQYVFISDTLSVDTKNIVLYDLKNNRTLSKYESVDTSSYTKEDKLTFKTGNDIRIMAKNKSGKYGMIKIEEEVKGAIPFNYNSIEKLRDYYVVSDSSNSYVMLDASGNVVAGKYNYKIVDYKGNYLKAIDNNKYYVYDFKGNKIDDTSYLYIDLQDDYYAVITTDKKLDIKKYTTEFGLEEPIDIGSTTDYKNAFTITKTTTGYTVKITSTNETKNIPADGKNGPKPVVDPTTPTTTPENPTTTGEKTEPNNPTPEGNSTEENTGEQTE